MPRAGAEHYEVAIVGAGPVGLTLANYLGMSGVRTIVVERLPSLIDYPRGVGMDDECLRAFQAIGLAEAVQAHTTPDHWLRFMTGRGRCFASIEPRLRPYGWPRRNAFVQPLVDKVLLEGVRRFPTVEVAFDSELVKFSQDADGVEVRVATGKADRRFTADYLVGCDGGKSPVRKTLGVGFEGATESTQWLVVDVLDDPVGTPDAYLVCDPDRPYVSIGLPHGIRRFEFQVMPGETEEEVCSPAGLLRLLAKVVPDPEAVRIIRSRVYTHHARLAARFRVGRVLLAGDAAHLMPVWQGQGYNSGIRDANNLGWKLAAVCKGVCGPGLLDSYETERRAHARAMIALSLMAGRIFAPPRRWQAGLRDMATLALNHIPSVKNYFVQMRFKPMPRYLKGAVVHDRLDRAAIRHSPVGQLFAQPEVLAPSGDIARFDDAVGQRFVLLAWGSDPSTYLDPEARRHWTRLGGVVAVAKPASQLTAAQAAVGPDVVRLGDASGELKAWFSGRPASLVFLRPDRFVAAVCSPQEVNQTIRRLAETLEVSTSTVPPQAAGARGGANAPVPASRPASTSRTHHIARARGESINPT